MYYVIYGIGCVQIAYKFGGFLAVNLLAFLPRSPSPVHLEFSAFVARELRVNSFSIPR